MTLEISTNFIFVQFARSFIHCRRFV